MRNLAGVEECDNQIRYELEAAGVELLELPEILRNNGEVPWCIAGEFHGWTFERGWRYWMCKSSNPLLKRFAKPLNELYGDDIRAFGYGYEDLDESQEYSKPWCLGVNSYHIDSQEGLSAFVEMVKMQTDSFDYDEGLVILNSMIWNCEFEIDLGQKGSHLTDDARYGQLSVYEDMKDELIELKEVMSF